YGDPHLSGLQGRGVKLLDADRVGAGKGGADGGAVGFAHEPDALTASRVKAAMSKLLSGVSYPRRTITRASEGMITRYCPRFPKAPKLSVGTPSVLFINQNVAP